MDGGGFITTVYCLGKWLLEADDLSPIEQGFSQHKLHAEINCASCVKRDDYYCKIQDGCALNNTVYQLPI